MIVLVHNGHTAEAVFSISENIQIDFDANKPIANVLFQISKTNPNELLIWVNANYKNNIDYDSLHTVFHHKGIMASYAITGDYCISNQIGYVEKTPYTNVKSDVNYPTWLMSSDVGGIYAETLNTISAKISKYTNFDFFLSALAKQNMPQGLFCYSNPMLIKSDQLDVSSKKNDCNDLLFKFVKQHYKTVWVFNLLLCFIFFENRFPLLPFFKALFVKRNTERADFSALEVKSSLKVVKEKTIDVIIPTIGRRDSLYDVLKDLGKQTHFPKHVIIVEQNPQSDSKSELDFLTTETWPFNIKHRFIHQTGACNARNIALSLVESEWVLLGDDDNRFDSDLIENLFINIEKFGVTVATTMYIQPNETPKYLTTNQTDIFGSGNSMLKSDLLKKVAFDMAFEFGYGEDSDFGMQLRKIGHDVIYFPKLKITHLKLPFGGFRTKFVHGWEHEAVQPKPSPTIMVLIKKHYNVYQKNGYKFMLFLKFYKKQSIKKPFAYLKQMKRQWERSEYWASELFINEKSKRH
tara:strand:- start:118475 stop:120037 length:1563 start_codon:yes stop_codon:yes gene_type:complete